MPRVDEGMIERMERQADRAAEMDILKETYVRIDDKNGAAHFIAPHNRSGSISVSNQKEANRVEADLKRQGADVQRPSAYQKAVDDAASKYDDQPGRGARYENL